MKRATPHSTGSISPPPIKRKIDSTTTSKAVATFFKPASQRPPENLIWRIVENSLVVGRYNPNEKTQDEPKLPVKVAAFDLDDTIIVANTGSKWARSPTSWKWWDQSIPGRLKQLHEEGYAIVFLSNQGNVSLKDNPKSLQKDTPSLVNLKNQITSIFRQLDIPLSFYGATAQDRFRKPRTGMWDEMLDDLGLQAEDAVDVDGSFYVGDAAGRAKTDQRNKDHAPSDRHLAANIGIRFQTPEEFFLGAAPEPYDHGFDPLRHLERAEISQTSSEVPKDSSTAMTFTKNDPQELVIFCGSPGAGKSTFFWDVLEPLGYERVNQDILKTRDRCIKKTRELLAAGSSVAVDNTNADIETRAYWVKLAQEFKVPIRLVRFTASSRLAEHNDAVRAMNLTTMNPEARKMLPGIAFRSFLQRLQEPTLKEGFKDIYRVDFQFKGTDEQKKLWSRYWVSRFST
ncbi:polynucleotide kinase 3'-phosphatase [Exophiala mesophila]|uniref:Polynucleotide kinase 3'-phosphatase n=1 Tax=Exophiala mesophila TaxID=212818 RepID=A0A0D1XJK0_EXOME|nr:polynucleotide kinase 3'-phosphatase [Exophiala mesophila]KIV88376.1 polynucleotide kinase 3'-phosphatase [Exophiala mesophila]